MNAGAGYFTICRHNIAINTIQYQAIFLEAIVDISIFTVATSSMNSMDKIRKFEALFVI